MVLALAWISEIYRRPIAKKKMFLEILKITIVKHSSNPYGIIYN